MKNIFTRIFLAATLYSCFANAQTTFPLLRSNASYRKTPSQSEYHPVKIWMEGRPTSDLAKIGIDLTEGDYRKGVWFISDFDNSSLAKIKKSGFRTEVVIEDVKQFYKNRIASSARQSLPTTIQSAACGMVAPNY